MGNKRNQTPSFKCSSSLSLLVQRHYRLSMGSCQYLTCSPGVNFPSVNGINVAFPIPHPAKVMNCGVVTKLRGQTFAGDSKELNASKATHCLLCVLKIAT